MCECFIEKFCVYIHGRYRSAGFSPCDVFVGFRYQGHTGLIKTAGRRSALLCFLEETVCAIGVISFLSVRDICQETPLDLEFVLVVGRFSATNASVCAGLSLFFSSDL